MTQADIDFVKNLLRQGSVRWRGRAECLRRARKKVLVRKSKQGKSIFKYHWKCAKCSAWYRDEKSMEVDHIIEVGPFSGDWNEFIGRVYCDLSNLQALCVACHLKKTAAYSNAKAQWKRKVKS